MCWASRAPAQLRPRQDSHASALPGSSHTTSLAASWRRGWAHPERGDACHRGVKRGNGRRAMGTFEIAVGPTPVALPNAAILMAITIEKSMDCCLLVLMSTGALLPLCAHSCQPCHQIKAAEELMGKAASQTRLAHAEDWPRAGAKAKTGRGRGSNEVQQ